MPTLPLLQTPKATTYAERKSRVFIVLLGPLQFGIMLTRDLQRSLADSRAKSPLTELDDDDVPDHTSLDLPEPGLGETEEIRAKFATVSVMRAQFGSLINLLSKRPTPAPTGIDPSEQMDMQLDEQLTLQAIAFDNTAVTDRNPFHIAQDHAEDREAELGTLRDTLAARSRQLEVAKISGEELAAARSLLQKEMEQLTTRISDLDRINASLAMFKGELTSFPRSWLRSNTSR
ncbi:Aminotransferase [Mycena indigotica]|uniref:Aminotransferase n=1 Tax=Mycena indigotica TaxID=2126181 RepID=A0A8H6S728_9AGAR|nr:Aminotransferase [Mycena indigotica]KAF7293498.1 Aminotransferase [Mycena indigotica]